MAVLNTTSPTDRPGAPTEIPSNTVPSSSARIAVSVTGFAYVGLQKTTDSVRDRPEARGIRRTGMIPARRLSRQSFRDVLAAPQRGSAGQSRSRRRWTDRKSGAEGKSVSVRVDLGGRRTNKKKKNKQLKKRMINKNKN